MAVVGMYDYNPENAFRVDLVNAMEAHDYHLASFALADRAETDERTATLKVTRDLEDNDYATLNQMRQDIVAALDEHGWTLKALKADDKDSTRSLTIVAYRSLANAQLRLSVERA